MKTPLAAALILLATALPASAQTYWEPSVEMNLQAEVAPFEYDGMYWHYYQHNWLVSQMLNGPYQYVQPVYVPVYIQQVLVQRVRAPRVATPQVDPQYAKRLAANPQMPTDAAVRNYFWGPQATTKVPTGIERFPR